MDLPVGSWIDELTTQYEFINPNTAIFLSLFQLISSYDPTNKPDDKAPNLPIIQHHRGLYNVIRIDRLVPRIACRIPSYINGTINVVLTQPRQATLEIPTWSMNQTMHELMGKHFLNQLRSQIALNLQKGPGPIVITEGSLSLNRLIEVRDSTNNAYQGDHLVKLPDAFYDGATISLPDATTNSIHAMWLARATSTSLSEPLALVLSLDGGRNNDSHLSMRGCRGRCTIDVTAC
jgi:hypothetical protein